MESTLFIKSCYAWAFGIFLFAHSAFGQVAATLTDDNLQGVSDYTIANSANSIKYMVMDEYKANGNKAFAMQQSYNPNDPNNHNHIPYLIVADKNAYPTSYYWWNFSGSDRIYPAMNYLQSDGSIMMACADNYFSGNYDISIMKYDVQGYSNFAVVNSVTTGDQTTPKLAIDYTRGEVIVAWLDQSGRDGSGYGIYARRIDNTQWNSGGNPTFIGTEFLLNTTITDNQVLDDIAINQVTGELYMSAHYLNLSGGNSYDIILKKFARNSDGTYSLTGAETMVNTYISGLQYESKITINQKTGAYVISWMSDGQDGSGKGAYAKIFDKNGKVLKGEFEINQVATDNQVWPKPIWDEQSNSLVFFYHFSNGSLQTIKYQVLDENYNFSGGEQDAIGGANLNTYYNNSFNVSFNQTTKKIFLAYDSYTTLNGTTSNGVFRQLSYTAPAPPLPALDYTQNNSQSLVINAPVSNVSLLNTLNTSQYAIKREYTDGMGRPNQIVTYKGTPGKNDIVQPITYDAYGRVIKTYLPYATSSATGAFRPSSTWSGPTGDQATFYATKGNVANDVAPYTTSGYESSPMNRFTSLTPPGSDWQTKPITYNERPNLLSDNVTQWTYNFANGTVTATSGTYWAANTLKVSISNDEDGKQTVLFKNFKDQILLTRVTATNGTIITTEQYSIYDDYGHLRYVFPPGAVNYLKNTYPTGNAITVTYNDATFTDKYAYAYNYDLRGREIEKKIPGRTQVTGTSAEFKIYDRMDRVVLTQDPVQRSLNQWIFIKYDILDRPVYTGLYSPGSNITRTAMQTNVNGTGTQQLNEVRQASAAYYGYSNNAYPTTNLEVLTVTYYDDYDFDYNGTTDYSYNNASGPTGQETSSIYSSLGLTTGTRVKVLGTTSSFLTKVPFFDRFGRPIQLLSNNSLNLGNMADLTTNVYDFSGKLLTTKLIHTPGGTITTIITTKTYDYDHADRLVNTWQQINSDPQVLVSHLNYNDLGQLIEKNLYSENQGATSLQSIDYTYNIRGWMTHINNSSLNTPLQSDPNYNNNNDVNDLFGMQLVYQNTFSGISSTQQYNGTISAILWKTNTPTVSNQKAYICSYDALNRLTSGTYGENISGNWTVYAGGSNGWRNYEAVGSYDLNGNIKSLQRYDDSGAILDDLTYSYANGSNQLTQVTDASGNIWGYNDGANSSTEYSYDANGSLVIDGNKAMAVTYNHLHLPIKITHSQSTSIINFTYDALGNKLKKYTTDVSGPYSGGINYVDGFEYVEDHNYINSLQSFAFSEGRVTLNGTKYSYEYILKDHLGNTRVTFDKDPIKGIARALQENNYYPFGMTIGSSLVWSGSSQGMNMHLYNGKEFYQEDMNLQINWNDYGFRMYDPAIGRWMVLDDLSERYYNHSPYAYVGNDPINAKDMDGRSWFKKAMKSVGHAAAKIGKVAAPIIIGIAVAVVITVASIGTLGAADVAIGTALLVGAAAGAAGAAASNVTSQVINNGGFQHFNVTSLAKDVVIGGVLGAATMGAGSLLGAGAKAAEGGVVAMEEASTAGEAAVTCPNNIYASIEKGTFSFEEGGPVTAKALGISEKSTAEDIVSSLNSKMNVGDYIEGSEISKINSNLELPGSLIDKIEKTEEGLKVDMNWSGRTAMKFTKYKIPNGTIFDVDEVPLSNNGSAFKIFSKTATLEGKSFNIYINNNIFSFNGLKWFKIW